jgi:isopentenyl-diphosphate Delta-isomerase
MKQMVVLVDENDKETGQMDKMEAHRKGVLHRAISVFVFNKNGEMLLQQRAAGKYHGALLWSNTCCSHPLPEESPGDAAVRRLNEEMGITIPLQFMFSFLYKANVENGLIEHELDHVFAGYFDGDIQPDPSEVASYQFKSIDDIQRELKSHPEKYTQWFRIIFEDVNRWYRERY